jgi:hypothetical protein
MRLPFCLLLKLQGMFFHMIREWLPSLFWVGCITHIDWRQLQPEIVIVQHFLRVTPELSIKLLHVNPFLPLSRYLGGMKLGEVFEDF